jgi:hypothetical protein
MPTPDWDNLGDFLDTDEFAVVARITPQVGPARFVNGIFDDKYLNAITGEYEADSSCPRFECKMADVAGLRRGDTWQQWDAKAQQPVGDAYALLTEPQPDGTGMAKLEMARDDAGP